MIKILLFVLFLNYSLYAEKFNLNDLTALIANKYSKTLIIDNLISNDFIIYSNSLNEDITLNTLKDICRKLNLNYSNKKNIIYISAKVEKSEKVTKKDEETYKYDLKNKRAQLNIRRVRTNIDNKTVLDICSLLDYKCLNIGNSEYLISSKVQKIDISYFKSRIKNHFYLQGHIYQLDLENLEENDININGLLNFSTLVGNSAFNFLGNFGTSYKSQNNDFSLNTVLRFLESKGLAHSLANPVFSIMDREKVNFVSGESIPIQTSSILNTKSDTIITTYENVDVGITISILPLILNDNSVNLNLQMNISSLLNYDSEKNLVNVSKKSLSGKYNLSLNQTLPLIQFENKFNREYISRTPVLSAIPLLGRLFTSVENSDSDKIIIILFKLVKNSNDIQKKYFDVIEK